MINKIRMQRQNEKSFRAFCHCGVKHAMVNSHRSYFTMNQLPSCTFTPARSVGELKWLQTTVKTFASGVIMLKNA